MEINQSTVSCRDIPCAVAIMMYLSLWFVVPIWSTWVTLSSHTSSAVSPAWWIMVSVLARCAPLQLPKLLGQLSASEREGNGSFRLSNLHLSTSSFQRMSLILSGSRSQEENNPFYSSSSPPIPLFLLLLAPRLISLSPLLILYFSYSITSSSLTTSSPHILTPSPLPAVLIHLIFPLTLHYSSINAHFFVLPLWSLLILLFFYPSFPLLLPSSFSSVSWTILHSDSETVQAHVTNIQRFNETCKYRVAQRTFYRVIIFRQYSVIFRLQNIQRTNANICQHMWLHT